MILIKATGILWAPVAWISKHFVDLNYNQPRTCKLLFFKKVGGLKYFSDIFIQLSRKEIEGVVV